MGIINKNVNYLSLVFYIDNNIKLNFFKDDYCWFSLNFKEFFLPIRKTIGNINNRINNIFNVLVYNILLIRYILHLWKSDN